MMTTNWLIILASALIPFLVALVWFHKSLFGGENWHSISDMSLEKRDAPVKPIKLFLSILLNVLICYSVLKKSIEIY